MTLEVQARQSISMRVLARAKRDMKALVHGDDFVSSGEGAEREWLCKGLKKFETKMGEFAEPNREMAPAKKDHIRG